MDKNREYVKKYISWKELENLMKSMRLDKMKKFVLVFLLSGCSAIVSLYPIYDKDVMHGERFWGKKGTKEQSVKDIYTDYLQ